MIDTILAVLQAHGSEIGEGVAIFVAGWLERHLRIGARSAQLVGTIVRILICAWSSAFERLHSTKVPAKAAAPVELTPEALAELSELLGLLQKAGAFEKLGIPAKAGAVEEAPKDAATIAVDTSGLPTVRAEN